MNRSLEEGSSGRMPKWVHAPMEGCSKALEICASSSGSTMEEADLNAKKSLASIFETKITSKFEVNTTSLSEKDKEELTEQVYSAVTESIDQVLKSVVIKKRFNQDSSFFSLASLDKSKAAKTVRLDMKSIDDQLDFLFAKGNRTSIKKMLTLFQKRQLLHERLILLDKGAMPSKYSFQQINSLKDKDQNYKISLSYAENFPDSMQKWFENLMNDLGYKVVNNSESNYQLHLDFLVSEEYLKVKGFKKYQFTVTGEAKNNQGQKIGTLSVNMISSGRTQTDSFQKIRNKMFNEVEQNLDKLNME